MNDAITNSGLVFAQNTSIIEVTSDLTGSDIISINNYSFEVGYTYEIKAITTMYDNKEDVETLTRICIGGILKEQKSFDIWRKNTFYEANQHYYYTPSVNEVSNVIFNCAKDSSENFYLKDSTLIIQKLI